METNKPDPPNRSLPKLIREYLKLANKQMKTPFFEGSDVQLKARDSLLKAEQLAKVGDFDEARKLALPAFEQLVAEVKRLHDAATAHAKRTGRL